MAGCITTNGRGEECGKRIQKKGVNHHQAEVPVQGKGESVDGKSSNISITPTHPADRAVGEGNV